MKEKVDATKEKFKKKTNFDDVLKAVDDLTDEQIAALKEKLEKAKAEDVEDADVEDTQTEETDSDAKAE